MHWTFAIARCMYITPILKKQSQHFSFQMSPQMPGPFSTGQSEIPNLSLDGRATKPSRDQQEAESSIVANLEMEMVRKGVKPRSTSLPTLRKTHPSSSLDAPIIQVAITAEDEKMFAEAKQLQHELRPNPLQGTEVNRVVHAEMDEDQRLEEIERRLDNAPSYEQAEEIGFRWERWSVNKDREREYFVKYFKDWANLHQSELQAMMITEKAFDV